jgi:hypothetical protein
MGQRAHCAGTLAFGTVRDDAMQNVRRNETAQVVHQSILSEREVDTYSERNRLLRFRQLPSAADSAKTCVRARKSRAL